MQKGFTLIELLVVITIGVLIVAVTATFSNRAIQTQELERAVEIIRSELETAQTDAIAGTRDTDWGVAFLPNSITRFHGSSYATRTLSFDQTATFSNAITISGVSEIVFTRPEGFPVTPGTITITNGGRTVTIMINAAGAIDVQ